MHRSTGRLAVVDTLEEAIYATGRNLFRLVPIYLLVWVAIFASTPILEDIWFNGLGWRFLPTYVLEVKDAPLQAVYCVVFLRLGLLGIEPSKGAALVDGTVARVALVLLAWFLGWALLDVVFRQLSWQFYVWTRPAQFDLNSWTYGQQAAVVRWSGWVERALKLVVVGCVYGQAATVVVHGRFDLREHVALLRADPVRLGLIVLAAAVLIDGLDQIWYRIVPSLPKLSRDAATLSEHWREALWSSLASSSRRFPNHFIGDVFGAMLLAATYRRLIAIAKLRDLSLTPDPVPFPSP